MNILVTGINGFIGASYAAHLRASGSAHIFGIDLQPAPLRDQLCDRYLQLDLADTDAMATLCALPRFDSVLHAGGISGFMVETDNPRRIFDVNVAGTMAVLEMVRQMACQRLVLCSTIMTYGPGPTSGSEYREADYPVPISVYGASKVALEGLMHGFVGQYGLDAVALRFSHVYGPGRTTECFVREMLSAAAEGRTAIVTQSSGSLRQWVHIDDVVESIVLAMQVQSPASRVFNITGDEQCTLAETAATIRNIVGTLDVRFDESRDLPNYRIGKLSIERARSVLGYSPRKPMELGFRDFWASSRAPSTT